MSNALTGLFNRHAALAMAKQYHFADVVKGATFDVDLRGGALTFGYADGRAPLRVAVQVLGSESKEAGTWLWSWANEHLAAELVVAARDVRAVGEREHVAELTTEELPLDVFQSKYLRLIAAGIARADAYYRWDYGAGAATLLIRDPAFPPFAPSAQRMATDFTTFIENLDVDDHRAAFLGYVAGLGLAADERGSQVTARAPARELDASFDDKHRLTQLRAR